MSSRHRVQATVLRPLILALTGLAVWGVLWVGQQSGTLDVGVGDIAPETFVTERSLEILDEGATEQLRQEAAAAVEQKYSIEDSVEEAVRADIRQVFDDAIAGAEVPGPTLQEQVAELATTTTTAAEPDVETTTTLAPEDPAAGAGEDEPPADETTTTTTIPSTADITGQLYIDVNGDDTFVDADDEVIPDVLVLVNDSLGVEKTARTSSSGVFVVRDLAAGPATVSIDANTVPAELTTDLELLTSEIVLVVSDTVELPSVPFDVDIRDRGVQIDELGAKYGSLDAATVELLVNFVSDDVVRAAAGQPTWLEFIETPSISRAVERLAVADGIRADQLNAVKQEIRSSIPILFLPGDVDFETANRASIAASQIAAEFLQANSVPDPTATEDARLAAVAAIEDQYVTFEAGDVIAEVGTELDEIQVEALHDAGFFRPAQIELVALAAIVTLIIAVLAIYIASFRPRLWGQMRRLSSFGVLIVLAAAGARGVSLFIEDAPEVGYLMPAAAIGLMAAILFDARIAVLMAVASGAITAVASGDAGLTMFATIATITPVPWVSSISARNDLRKAVVFSTIGITVVAAGTAWFFQGESFVLIAAGYGAINGVVSGLVGTAALSFFEIAFDLTTNLRLLDITDRNHAALRLLEEKATGTFNHSLMVGTLADRAARAIGANALLARAAAYYHDLGKTENPQFFIENQFGISNPHDAMPPEESAAVIRQHVIDGQVLARRFDLPSEVIEGVITHHGDGIMRYFYHKALERYGDEDVSIDDYRHAGHKPQTREMAIVMMADSVEGACRAIFEKEDPSPAKITEVVERIVGEKVNDGQLSECDLTLSDLTTAKAAMAEALRGHYHQRIPYPNFPQLEADGDGGGERSDHGGGDGAVAAEDPAEAHAREHVEDDVQDQGGEGGSPSAGGVSPNDASSTVKRSSTE
jgi:putative nucleotidyltransferase with HDIG domain